MEKKTFHRISMGSDNLDAQFGEVLFAPQTQEKLRTSQCLAGENSALLMEFVGADMPHWRRNRAAWFKTLVNTSHPNTGQTYLKF
jgi:hypothetical protein